MYRVSMTEVTPCYVDYGVASKPRSAGCTRIYAEIHMYYLYLAPYLVSAARVGFNISRTTCVAAQNP